MIKYLKKKMINSEIIVSGFLQNIRPIQEDQPLKKWVGLMCINFLRSKESKSLQNISLSKSLEKSYEKLLSALSYENGLWH